MRETDKDGFCLNTRCPICYPTRVGEKVPQAKPDWPPQWVQEVWSLTEKRPNA